jgi:hypothetical protein
VKRDGATLGVYEAPWDPAIARFCIRQSGRKISQTTRTARGVGTDDQAFGGRPNHIQVNSILRVTRNDEAGQKWLCVSGVDCRAYRFHETGGKFSWKNIAALPECRTEKGEWKKCPWNDDAAEMQYNNWRNMLKKSFREVHVFVLAHSLHFVTYVCR